MSKRRSLNKIAYVSVILILVLLMIFSGLQVLESTVFSEDQNPTETIPHRTIVRDGISYFPRQDITVVMILGIDKFGVVESSGSYNNDGAADMVSLAVFDEKTKTCTVLCLNRDTMLEMPVLGIGGKEAGTVTQQLALAHTYGSGLEDSCENTRKTVSNFLYGLQIDYYVSMNMDAISILNDAVGGVTVTVTDDFSAIDPTITKGEITLNGAQAVHFVRTRKEMGDQTNISRMERQKQYMDGFLEAFHRSHVNNAQFLVETYDTVSDYIVTDCTLNAMTGLLEQYADYTLNEVISPEGEAVLGETYYEFHVDKEKLDDLILELFYAPK